MQFRSRSAASSALVLCSLLAAPGAARAQLSDSVHIAIGAPVWVRMRDGTQGAWRFEGASRDSLTLERRVYGGELLRSIPWNEAERIDTIVRGLPSGRRMFAGALVGGLLGYGVAFVGATSGSCQFDNGGSCPGLGFAILTPAIVGTGIVTGAIVGLHRRPWHWSTAWRAPAAPRAQDH